MYYFAEFDINTFDFWDGACEVIKRIRKEDLLEEAEQLIENEFANESPTATRINNYVWYHLEDDLCKTLVNNLWSRNN